MPDFYAPPRPASPAIDLTPPLAEIPAIGKLSPRQLELKLQVNDIHTVIAHLDNGTLAVLPDNESNADTSIPVNPVTGQHFSGKNALMLKIDAKKNGYPSNEYVSIPEAYNASTFTQRRLVKPIVPKGVALITGYNENGNPKVEKFYNIALFVDKEAVRSYGKYLAHQKTLLDPEKTMTPPLKKQSLPYPPVVCNATSVREYLTQYFIASETNKHFKVSRIQAKEFSGNLKAELAKTNPQGKKNAKALQAILDETHAAAKEEVFHRRARRETPAIQASQKPVPSRRQAPPSISL